MIYNHILFSICVTYLGIRDLGITLCLLAWFKNYNAFYLIEELQIYRNMYKTYISCSVNCHKMKTQETRTGLRNRTLPAQQAIPYTLYQSLVSPFVLWVITTIISNTTIILPAFELYLKYII